MRVAVVNDMNMALQVLRQLVLSRPGYEIAWTACSGREAVEKCMADTPDLILMDLVMPEMGGVEATRKIMATCPCAILVVTASVGHKADLVFEALGAGALDAVKTPGAVKLGDPSSAEPIFKKMATLERLIAPLPARQSKRPPPAPAKGCPLIALGASSGGPQALSRVLSELPRDLPAAMLIIQHIDGEFINGLVDWLDDQCSLPVQLAEEGQRPRPGQVLVAGSQGNLVLQSDGILHYSTAPSQRLNRPSIDTLFESLAQNWKGPVTGVLLTGMGSDGAEGMLALRRAGHHTIAQDRESSVIFGMPEAAIRIGGTCEIVNLDKLSDTLQRRLNRE